ncbi:MAG TPA: glycosyltransferase family 39 protein, partial [Vicinamibacterales bacterium]
MIAGARRAIEPAWIAALVVVCAAALALRLIGLRYGLPAVYNPDEVAIMSRALAFATGDLNPHNFLYPSFYFYVLFAWEGLTALWSVAIGAVASLGDFQRQFFIDPTRVYVAGRLLTTLTGVLTVAATYSLGRRVAGPLAGLSAALFLAIAPLHVRDSHYVKHDVPVTLLIVVAYVAYERLWNAPPDDRSRTPLIAAAAATGAAFSTHYYSIFLAIPLAWSAAQGARDRREAFRRIALAAVVSGAVFFVLSPFILAEPSLALRDIRANRQIVVDRAIGTLGYGETAARYAAFLWRDGVGWPVVLAAIIGIATGARNRPRTTAWLLSFPIPFLLFIAGTYPATRYLIPVLPFVAIFGGMGIAALSSAHTVVAAAALAAVCVVPLRDSIRIDLFIRHADTRTLAERFIETAVPSGSTILTQPYSVPLTASADVLREAVARSGRDMPTRTRLEIARQPYPSPSYRLIYLGRGLDVDKLYLPYDQLDGGDPISPVRRERVAFVVLKRYNTPDPATLPLLTALAREGRRIAVFSPYRDGSGGAGPEPFLHNTDARIDPL